MTIYTFEQATYGFETAKDILGVGPNTMAKLIDLNLIDVLPDGAKPRNQRYLGSSISYLLPARNRPLRLAADEKALIVSMGVEHSNLVPSPYFDATWGHPRCEETMARVLENVDDQTEQQIRDGLLRVTGYWRVSQENVDFLVARKCVFLASYAGFLLEGGRIQGWVEGANSPSGGRCFLIKPFDRCERSRYAHTYLAPRRGPMNRVWSADELEKEAEELE